MAKKVILCVDDEKIILDTLLDQMYEAFGDNFVYEVAESVDEAWEVIDYLKESGLNLHLVISDWLMPGIKGDEFLINIHERYPQTAKILLSGQVDDAAVQNAFDYANLYVYLKKPWIKEQLITKIEESTSILK
ncbi:MAG: response regulator [Bacteroidia bacterium]|nr:response regulator [Bacteroidia bacterium]